MDYLSMIQGGENATLEFKERGILSNSDKLCKVITGMANNIGGHIFIGVRDNGELEGINYDKNDEEKIMSIIYDKCQPRLKIEFKPVNIFHDADIYVLKIPKMDGIPYAVKRYKNSLNYYIRHGTETRLMPFNELESFFKKNEYDITKGIEIPIRASYNFLPSLGEFIIKYLYKNQKSNLKSLKILLGLTGIISLLIFTLPILMYQVNKTQAYIEYYSNTPWFFMTLLLIFSFSLSFLKVISETQCPSCKTNFSYRLNKKWVFNKRKIDDDYEEWTIRTLKNCKICRYYEYSNPTHETININKYYNR